MQTILCKSIIKICGNSYLNLYFVVNNSTKNVSFAFIMTWFSLKCVIILFLSTLWENLHCLIWHIFFVKVSSFAHYKISSITTSEDISAFLWRIFLFQRLFHHQLPTLISIQSSSIIDNKLRSSVCGQQ